jgi:hypothetical protein
MFQTGWRSQRTLTSTHWPNIWYQSSQLLF